MEHLKAIIILIVVSSFITGMHATSEPVMEERCYTSTNSRGEGFWLHINYDRAGNAKSIRYKDKTTSIPLSYYGRELVHLPEYGVRIYARTYFETYKGKVTGKLYLLEERLDTGIGVVFERVKDRQIFYFEDCEYGE